MLDSCFYNPWLTQIGVKAVDRALTWTHRTILTTEKMLSMVALFYLSGLAAYLGSLALNGFSFTHTWLLQHPWSIALLFLFPLAFLPVSRLLLAFDWIRRERSAALSQLSFTGLMLVAVTFPIWAYFQFRPPTTGIGRVTNQMVGIVFWIGFFKSIVATTIYKSG